MSVRVSKDNLQSSVLVILQLFGNEVGFCRLVVLLLGYSYSNACLIATSEVVVCNSNGYEDYCPEVF